MISIWKTSQQNTQGCSFVKNLLTSLNIPQFHFSALKFQFWSNHCFLIWEGKSKATVLESAFLFWPVKRCKVNWICHESHLADPPRNCLFGLFVCIFAVHAAAGSRFALLPGQVTFCFSSPAIAHHRLQVEAVYRRCNGKWCCRCVLSSVYSKHSQWLLSPS